MEGDRAPEQGAEAGWLERDAGAGGQGKEDQRVRRAAQGDRRGDQASDRRVRSVGRDGPEGHGAAHPDDEGLRARASEWFDEEKASVEISRNSPDEADLTFKWKPSAKKERLFPAAGDAFY